MMNKRCLFDTLICSSIRLCIPSHQNRELMPPSALLKTFQCIFAPTTLLHYNRAEGSDEATIPLPPSGYPSHILKEYKRKQKIADLHISFASTSPSPRVLYLPPVLTTLRRCTFLAKRKILLILNLLSDILN